jgi:nucleoside diphosphate kinase
MSEQTDFSKHRTNMGRVAIVDRVHNGVIQIRKIINETKGFKIVDGKLVKMTPEEIRARKRGAKVAVRKRKSEAAQIKRNLLTSLRKRKVRLG